MVKIMDYKAKYGVTYREWLELRAKIMFKQDYKCFGCSEPIGVKRGDKHMHHINGNSKDTYEDNLMVVCPLDHWFVEGFQLKQFKKLPVKYITLARFVK